MDFSRGRNANHTIDATTPRRPITPKVFFLELLSLTTSWYGLERIFLSTGRHSKRHRSPGNFPGGPVRWGGLVLLGGLDDKFEVDLVADDNGAVLKGAFEVHVEVATVDVG